MSKQQESADRQDEFDYIVNLVRQRMLLQHIGHRMITGLLFGLIAAMLVQLIARWVPLEYYRIISLCVVCMLIVVAAVYGWLQRPTKQHAIRWMDDHGLNEQMTTAQQFMQVQSPIANIQREEALIASRTFSQTLPERMKFQVHRRTLLFLLGGIIGFGGLFLWPNDMDERIKARNAAKQWTEEQLQRIDEVTEQWQDEPQQNEAAEKLKQELLALRNQLSEAKDPSEALKQMEQALQRLEQQSKLFEQENKRLDEWTKEWDHPALKELGQALQHKSSQQIADQLNQLKEEVEKMSEQARSELAKKLEQLAKNAPFAEEQKQAMKPSALQDACALQVLPPFPIRHPRRESTSQLVGLQSRPPH